MLKFNIKMNSVKKDLDILFERNLKWRLLKRAFTSAEGIRVLVNIFRYYDVTNTGKINKNNWVTAILDNGLLIGITKDQLTSLFDKYKEENTEMIDYKKFAFDLFFHPSNMPLKKNNINNNYNYNNTEEVNNSPKKYNNNFFLNINETSSVSKSQNFNNNNLNNSFPLMSPNSKGRNINNMRYYYFNHRMNNNANNIISGIDYSGTHVNMIRNSINYFKSKININNGLNYYRLLSQLKSKCSIDNTIPKNFLPIALQNIGVFYTQNELQNFLYALGCQEITVSTFSFSKLIELIKDEMNEVRKNIVINAFNHICTTLNKSSDSITLNDLKELFKPEMHPEVLNQRRTPNDIYIQFTETLEIYGELNNIINNITLEQFIDYYSGISPSIYNDTYFEHIINNVWQITSTNNNGNIISTPNISGNNENNGNINSSIQKSPSMPKIYDKLNIDTFNINYNQSEKNKMNVNENVYSNSNNYANKERNNNSNTKINLPLFYYNKNNNYRNFGGVSKSTNFTENNDLFQKRYDNYELTPHSKEEYQKLYEMTENNNIKNENNIRGTPSNIKISDTLLNKDLNSLSTNEGNNNKSIEISPIINKIREIFIIRGIKSIFYFQRMLYVYDINHTGEISFTNLQNIIQAYNYNFSKEEINALFQYYDKENTGFIKYNYLFMEILGDMNMMRYTLVKKLFDAFPKNQNGSIDIDVIKKSFCPTQHYEVINGNKKTDEVYREFLELIEIFREYKNNLKGGVTNNELTCEEFCDFFGEISLEIQNDYAFSNLVQNCWRINTDY